MPRQFIKSVTFEIQPGSPIALQDIECHREILQRKGVYLLREGLPTSNSFAPLSAGVIYIGKAIRETIFSRCFKHRAALRGDPNMRPGKNFMSYRADVPNAIDKLYVIPGFMDAEPSYLISCAEEFLLHRYAQRHKKRPRANTK